MFTLLFIFQRFKDHIDCLFLLKPNMLLYTLNRIKTIVLEIMGIATLLSFSLSNKNGNFILVDVHVPHRQNVFLSFGFGFASYFSGLT